MALFDAYESWAKQQGCAYAGVATIGKDSALATFYRLRGYVLAEQLFLKAL